MFAALTCLRMAGPASPQSHGLTRLHMHHTCSDREAGAAAGSLVQALHQVYVCSQVLASGSCPQLHSPSGLGPCSAGEGQWERIRCEAEPAADHVRFSESFETGHSNHDFSKALAQQLRISRPPLRIDSQAKYGVWPLLQGL